MDKMLRCYVCDRDFPTLIRMRVEEPTKEGIVITEKCVCKECFDKLKKE